MCHFQYCTLIWCFCNKSDLKKIEKIQERALRFVFSDFDSSYENLLILSKLPSVKCLIDRKIATEVFKAVNNLTPSYISDLFKIKVNTANLRRRKKLEIPSINTTTFGLHSISHYGAKLWNELPETFRICESLSEFKRMIKNWSGSSCKCTLCRCTLCVY